jgi:hypothetical protein
MAKVLDTDIGPQLTGAVHLRTLECGDEVVKLGLVWRVIENVLLAPRAGVRLQNRAGDRRRPEFHGRPGGWGSEMSKPPPMSRSNKAGFVLLVVLVIAAVAACPHRKNPAPQPTPSPSTASMRTAVQR